MKIFSTALTVLTLLALSIPATWAQDTATDTPTVKEILDNYFAATGGHQAYVGIKTIISEGEMSIPQAGITGKFVMRQKAPNKARMEIEIDGVGNQSQGSDGTTAWQDSQMTGPEIMEGEQKDQFMMQTDIQPYTDFEKKYASVKCTGIEDFNDEKCYVVVAQPKTEGADPTTAYFSVKSGLHVGSKLNQVTAMGKMEIITTHSDYKDVNGIKVSHKAVAELPNGLTQEIAMTSVKINEEIEDSAFDLPKAIQDLMNKN